MTATTFARLGYWRDGRYDKTYSKTPFVCNSNVHLYLSYVYDSCADTGDLVVWQLVGPTATWGKEERR